jgi:hypothetical protein
VRNACLEPADRFAAGANTERHKLFDAPRKPELTETRALGFLLKVLVPAQEGFAVLRCFFHVKHEQMTVLDQEGI